MMEDSQASFATAYVGRLPAAMAHCLQLRATTAAHANVLPAHLAIPIAQVGLIAMDMDSTAITIECIDEIADFADVKAEVSAITEAAMRGELNFQHSLIARVACLEGLSTAVLVKVYESRLRPSPGLAELMVYAHDLKCASN